MRQGTGWIIGLGAMCALITCRVEADAVTAVSRLQEYCQFLSIPNVAADPGGLRRNAEFILGMMKARGIQGHLLEDAGGIAVPALYGEVKVPGARQTLLFYAHYDGQPVVPAEWSQKDPFAPVVRRRNAAGGWDDVDAEVLQAQPLDPELRVFARSASDDKAPIVMLLTALDMLAARAEAPAFNVKVLLDGEEEMSSPSLASTVASDAAAFRTDALAILDGPKHESRRPTVMFGNRGIAQTTLTVFGPRAPLHSGHYGNYAPNPALRLAKLLASMKDDDGRVTIEGFYAGVNITAADRLTFADVGDDEPALRARLGIGGADRVGASYQEALQYPSLNIRGLSAGGVGAVATNTIPAQAVAEIDMRTTPETDGRHLFDLVRAHIERAGYHLVTGEPTDADRAKFDKLASFTLGASTAAERMPMDSGIGRWAIAALRAPTAPRPGEDPVRIRMMGATVPTDALVSALKAPFVLVPTVNADNNQHAANENLRIGDFVAGTETLYSLLVTPYRR